MEFFNNLGLIFVSIYIGLNLILIIYAKLCKKWLCDIVVYVPMFIWSEGIEALFSYDIMNKKISDRGLYIIFQIINILIIYFLGVGISYFF